DEHRGRRPDAHRQSKDRDSGKRGPSAQHTNGIASILSEHVKAPVMLPEKEKVKDRTQAAEEEADLFAVGEAPASLESRRPVMELGDPLPMPVLAAPRWCEAAAGVDQPAARADQSSLAHVRPAVS